MKSLGADNHFLMLSALPHNKAVMPSSTRTLAAGDIILAELSPSYDGQYVQICRSAILGKAGSVLEEKYALVLRAMRAGIDAVRPGVAMSAVSTAIDRVLQQAGYAEYCRPPFIRRRGHGLGSGLITPGDVASDNDAILEEGMLFVVHPNQYLPQTGYLLCGEPVLVTASGAEVLSRQPARLHSIGV
jgi:Xaa-Pro dipeptidase